MIHPRVALATGLAAVAGAALLLLGRIDGSVIVVVVLALAARAACFAADGGPASMRALARLLAVVPVWVLAALVATERSGDPMLSSIRGANAVAGPALWSGRPLMIAACWLALIAALGAAAFVAERDSMLATSGTVARLEPAALVVELALLVTLFAGPHVSTIADGGVWVGASVVGGAAVRSGGSRIHDEWWPRALLAIAVAALVVAVLGDPA